jgi:Zn-dependent metalloprotease
MDGCRNLIMSIKTMLPLMHIGEKKKRLFSTVHGRNSYDNLGGYKSYVHFDVDYDNAYWNGSVMTYGDGSGTILMFLTSIDVAAHELDMLFVKTANLAYQKKWSDE